MGRATASPLLRTDRQLAVARTEGLEVGLVPLTPPFIPGGEQILWIGVAAGVVEDQIGPALRPQVNRRHRRVGTHRHFEPGRHVLYTVVIGHQIARGQQAGNHPTVLAGRMIAAAPLLNRGHAHADQPSDIPPGEAEMGEFPE